MEEIRDDKVCLQSYYADNKNDIYDSDLLEDISLLWKNLILMLFLDTKNGSTVMIKNYIRKKLKT